MLRTNHAGVVENAEFNIDQEEYRKNLAELFPPKKVWCDECEKRLSLCECSQGLHGASPREERE